MICTQSQVRCVKHGLIFSSVALNVWQRGPLSTARRSTGLALLFNLGPHYFWPQIKPNISSPLTLFFKTEVYVIWCKRRTFTINNSVCPSFYCYLIDAKDNFDTAVTQVRRVKEYRSESSAYILIHEHKWCLVSFIILSMSSSSSYQPHPSSNTSHFPSLCTSSLSSHNTFPTLSHSFLPPFHLSSTSSPPTCRSFSAQVNDRPLQTDHTHYQPQP